ncbi:hypothetical protein [Cupriavidus pauculus]|uniref:hypothetical protein n=1 Tax=Cupriavidus pauculus TaxID=82633 RepID=UPI003857B9D9
MTRPADVLVDRPAMTIQVDGAACWLDAGTAAEPHQVPADWRAIDATACGFVWSMLRRAGNGKWQPFGPVADRIEDLLPEVRGELSQRTASTVRVLAPDAVVDFYC